MAKAKKKKLSSEEILKRKEQSDHKTMVRAVFRSTGFRRIPNLSDKAFVFDGQETDFDDVFVYENIILCIEYTTSKSSKISDHLKPKKIVYDKITNDAEGFFNFYCALSDDLRESVGNFYNSDEIIIRIVYCSLNAIDPVYKENVPNPIYLDYAELRYFNNMADCIKKSARHELCQFLNINSGLIGRFGKIGIAEESGKYPGSLLPETNSFFEKGYKIVSFYIDPQALLERAYVLRKDGWRDSHSVYQRMISKTKIESIRKYLRDKKRVFVNNIIATLDGDTKIVDSKGNTVDPVHINKTKPVHIQIPNRINSIGLIDGQHRTYSYYEGVSDDPEIAKLRIKQNLLVTGIIYPEGVDNNEREKFEARLFLEINSTQTNAKSNLKQAIGLVLEPFSAESIATRVLVSLDKSTGPLNGKVERYWFDKNKLKTTSVVSYGMKPLVKTFGTDSLFNLWSNKNKDVMVSNEDHSLLAEYVTFSSSQINMLLSAVRKNLPSVLWTTDKYVEGRILTTTNINCFLICLRILIENKKALGFEYYDKNLKHINQFEFKIYHSSQYKNMAAEIYQKFFC